MKDEVTAQLITHKAYTLFKVLKEFRKHYSDHDKPDYLSMPYTVMCAVCLEAAINDELVLYNMEKFGNAARQMSEAYLSMPLISRVNIIASIFTSGKYTINKDHDVYQKIISLIRLRNNLVHPKPIVTQKKFNIKSVDIKMIEQEMTRHLEELDSISNDLTLGSAKSFTPEEYHEALEQFNNLILSRRKKGNTINPLLKRVK
ncbi:MAG: hypothetical protein AB9900_12140 [Humidesulfovibrio sp.]